MRTCLHCGDVGAQQSQCTAAVAGALVKVGALA